MAEEQQYNTAEEQEIAAIMYNKEMHYQHKNGVDEKEAAFAAQQKSDEARRRYALEFLKKLEKKLSELSNQEIADILRALIASGLPIETEEELEYWIRRLERESMYRIAIYFVARNESADARTAKYKKKFLKNIKDFTAEDIEALVSMMTSINRIIDRKAPKDKNSEEYKRFLERKKFFKKVEQVLLEDAKEKQLEKRRARRNNPQAQQEEQPDYLDLLKSKMLREGVVQGGKYWDSVIEDFNHADNKGEFVSLWQKDEARQVALDSPDKNMQEQIQKLRGVDNLEERMRDEAPRPKDKQKSEANEANTAAQQAAQAQAQANAAAGR